MLLHQKIQYYCVLVEKSLGGQELRKLIYNDWLNLLNPTKPSQLHKKMANLTFQYPAWYLIFCVLLGAAYALVLYFRDKTFAEQSAWLRGLLAALRFITVTILSMLLLSPLLKSIVTNTQKPIIVLAQDESESVGAALSSGQRPAYQSAFQKLANDLSKQYDVKQYAFGNEMREGIPFKYADKITNLSEVLTNVYDLYSNQNLGAIVLATDGIYNEGSNPVYLNTKITAPIYTVALGDTTIKKDVILKRVFNNKIAYLGDKFSVQIDITAQNSAGSATSLSVYKVEGAATRKLQQLPVNIDRNDFFTTRELVLDADQAGVQRYRIVLSAVPGEASSANNSKDIFVEVLDARQKILILANSPHPDISAIRQMIESNKNYQVEIAFINSLTKNVGSYDFVILHQLPSRNNDAASVLATLQNKRIPRLFIAGIQTNFSRLNQIQSLVNIQSDGRNTNDVQGRIAPAFNNFTISDRLINELPNFPPLTAPFGEFKAAAGASVLLYQRIGKVDTRYPLLVLGEELGVKTGVLCAEGLWKWRLFDYLQNQNHELFSEVVGKSVQFLSVKEDKRKFRVTPSKNIFNENEIVYFDAELYNDNYELINEPDATIIISNADRKEFNFTFNKTGRAYTLNAGIFPVGNYTYRAAVNYNGQNLSTTGQFSVQPIQLELFETTANHNLLRQLSDKFGGAMVYPNQMTSITNLIEQKGTVKPVIYQTAKTRPVINLKWIFFLLLFLLTGEWFLRRYFGAY